CFINKIDAKGRIFIPSKAKEGMGERMFVTISPEKDFLCVYNVERFQRLSQSFDKSKKMSKETKRKARRLFIGGALECEPDAQGRITISSNLWNHIGAKPTTEVCIYQYADMLEICTKEHYDNVESNVDLGDLDLDDFEELDGL
ncbi:MAG: hypothetical protein J5750_02820, partial [Clostridiales bacterium]|nr:hypothetical protein [Clostridiales bacterium]